MFNILCPIRRLDHYEFVSIASFIQNTETNYLFVDTWHIKVNRRIPYKHININTIATYKSGNYLVIDIWEHIIAIK